MFSIVYTKFDEADSFTLAKNKYGLTSLTGIIEPMVKKVQKRL